jgi:hypothetical protein
MTRNDMDPSFERRLAEDPQLATFQAMYLGGSIDGVSLVAVDANSCPACRAVNDVAYLPSHLPRLPIVGCTSDRGCRCRYEPNVTVYE